MVSEVVDNAVQSVWRRHGGVAGSEARQRVYARATWEAKRLRNDWRKQRGREGSLDDKKYMETVDTIARALLFDAEGALKDPRDYECMYEAHLDTDVFADFVQHPELRRILRLYMHGFTWTEIAAHVGRKPDAIRQSLFRAVRQFRWQRLLST
jgi:DNA-directed RNA polymerase specialized sigma24 family protein